MKNLDGCSWKFYKFVCGMEGGNVPWGFRSSFVVDEFSYLAKFLFCVVEAGDYEGCYFCPDVEFFVEFNGV